MLSDRHLNRGAHPETDGTPSTRAAKPSLIDQVGGIKGFIYSTVPVLVFVMANAVLSLTVAVTVALASGLALSAFRMWRGERLFIASGSLLGVAVASGVVALTGSARDFFAIAIWLSLAGFLVTFGSVLARRPLTGVIWNLMHGGAHGWRADGPVRQAHDLATLAVALVFGARFVVQRWLYVADSTAGLGIARITMGVPLTVLAALVVVWAFRRSTRRLAGEPLPV